MKFLGETKVQKPMLLRVCRGRMKLWILRVIVILSLWTCVIQLVAVGDFRGAKLLKDWPSYVSSPDKYAEENKSFVQSKVHLPPKSESLALSLSLVNGVISNFVGGFVV